VNSIKQTSPSLQKLIIYTNFDLAIHEKPEYVELREYSQINPDIHTEDAWLNLNLNRLEYYKLLMAEYSQSPIWLDLDTIVCRNIDHLDDFPNFFVQIGTNDSSIMNVLDDSDQFPVVRNQYLQGNIFKIDFQILDAAQYYLEKYRESIVYADMGAFNIVYHHMKERPQMHILGKDVDPFSINSFEAWNIEKGEHPNDENANNLFLDLNGNICSIFHPGKEIQFISFTFRTYLKFLQMDPESNSLAKYLHSFDCL
jgi:hypothetical protein